jgi:hypothetical protein
VALVAAVESAFRAGRYPREHAGLATTSPVPHQDIDWDMVLDANLRGAIR